MNVLRGRLQDLVAEGAVEGYEKTATKEVHCGRVRGRGRQKNVYV